MMKRKFVKLKMTLVIIHNAQLDDNNIEDQNGEDKDLDFYEPSDNGEQEKRNN